MTNPEPQTSNLPERLVCRCCRVSKPVPEFERAKSCRYGVRKTCKACRYADRLVFIRANPEKVRRDRLRFHYGISLEDWDRMHTEQGGKCAICQTTNPGKRGFHVDHNHTSQAVRQLLCSWCNTGIGSLKDSPEILAHAIRYLVRHGEAYPTEALADLLSPLKS